VHEAYLKLVDQRKTTWQSRAHFYGVAAHLMRRILVDHARKARAAKRAGGYCNIPLDTAVIYTEEKSWQLIAIDEALDRLAENDPRQGRVVELRFFGGRSEEEIAEILGVSVRTVKRDWRLARAWLYVQLSKK
jgi:RNA polymerase sigma factor (TIGR02999 family)